MGIDDDRSEEVIKKQMKDGIKYIVIMIGFK